MIILTPLANNELVSMPTVHTVLSIWKDHKVEWFTVATSDLIFNRNILFDNALKTKESLGLFLDSDNWVCREDLINLIQIHQETESILTSAICMARGGHVPAQSNPNELLTFDKLHANINYTVKRVGLGCTLVNLHWDGWQKFNPWFQFEHYPNYVGEDYRFSDKITELGGKITLTTKVIAGHLVNNGKPEEVRAKLNAKLQ